MKIMIKEIVQGASATWRTSPNLYKPSDGWGLKYYFRGPGQGVDIAATTEGDEFVLSLSPYTSVLAVGVYRWQAFAERNGEKIFVAEGEIQIKQGFAGSDPNEAVDTRSETKRILDAIDACIAKKATSDQLSYTIANRQLQRYSMTELLTARDKYQKMYNREKLAERAKLGGGILKTHLVRMKGE